MCISMDKMFVIGLNFCRLDKFDVFSWNLPGWAEENHDELCQISLSRRRDTNWAPAERVRNQKLCQLGQSTCLAKRFIMQYLVNCLDVRMVIYIANVRDCL